MRLLAIICSLFLSLYAWSVESGWTESERQLIHQLTLKPLTYLGEGGQAYVFETADGEHVVKIFKSLAPSGTIHWLPDLFFKTYKEKHIAKRARFKENLWNGYEIGHRILKKESALLFLQLQPSQEEKSATLIFNNGVQASVQLGKVPFAIQKKGVILSDALDAFLKKGDIEGAKKNIEAVFDLCLKEHTEGVYDADHGVMHNIGIVDKNPFHLDIGNLRYQEEESFFYEFGKVATKIYSWISKHYPHYSSEFCPFIEEKVRTLFNQPFFLNMALNSTWPHFILTPCYAHYRETLAKECKELGFREQEHAKWVETIRNQLSTLPQVQAKQVVEALFFTPNLHKEMEHFFFHFIAPPQHSLTEYLMSAHNNFEKNPNFKSLTDGEKSDNFKAGNIPSYLFTFGQTKVIRMAHPLTDFSRFYHHFFPPKVYPEFAAFISHQENHLYINLMQRSGMEKKGTFALENLEKNVKNFSIATLDKNSSFYWQKKPYNQENLSYNLFEKQFFSRLIDKNGSYYFPSKLNRPEWEKELAKLLKEVKNSYFPNKEMLTKKERGAFIELTYLKILDALVETLSPSSMNISCRSCIDRGPSLYVLWMAQKNLLSEKEIAAALLGPPLFYHNRGSYRHRIVRFCDAFEFSQNSLNF